MSAPTAKEIPPEWELQSPGLDKVPGDTSPLSATVSPGLVSLWLCVQCVTLTVFQPFGSPALIIH